MTKIAGDATHLKGKALSGSIQQGETWVFDGSRYIPSIAGSEIFDAISGLSGLVTYSDNNVGVVSGPASSGAVLMWSGSDIALDAYIDDQWMERLNNDLKHVENSLSMISWDLYSQDKRFDDIAIDDFEDQDGVDLYRSIAVFDSGEDCYTKVQAASGLQLDLDISSADHMNIPDLKDSIWRWKADSGAYGRFEAREVYLSKEDAINEGSGYVGILLNQSTARKGDTVEIRGTVNYDGVHTLPDLDEISSTKVIISASYVPESFAGSETVSKLLSLGSGNDCPNVTPGVRVSGESGVRTIMTVSGDGNASGAVELDQGLDDSMVNVIHGLEYSAAESGLTIIESPGQSGVNWSVTLDSDSSSVIDGETHRVVIDSGGISHSGSWVRLNFQAPDSGAINVEHAAIVERSGATSNGTEIPAELLFSGSGGFSGASGAQINSDWLEYTVDPAKSYLVIMDIAASGSNLAATAGSGITYVGSGASYNVRDLSGAQMSGVYSVTEMEVGSGIVSSDLFVAKTTDKILLSSQTGPTTPLSEIESVAITESSPGVSSIYHAVKIGGEDTWKVFVNSGWREIVSNLSGIWKYQNASGQWQKGTSNNEFNALYHGMSLTENQWTKADIEAMSSSDWSASGGFTQDASLDFAVGLKADGANVPSVDKYTINHSIRAHNISLELKSWEASRYDPEKAYCVIDLERNSATEPWSSGASGGAHRYKHTAVEQDGKLYFWGGYDRSHDEVNTVDIYDTASSTWQSGASGGAKRDSASAVVHSGKMYCFGGYGDLVGAMDNLDIYDISGDNWQSGAQGPCTRGYHTAVAYNNKMYCWGGFNSSGEFLNTMSVYDFQVSGWFSGDTGGRARISHSAVVYSGKMYCWGGNLETGERTNTLDIYDFATGSWSSGQAGGIPRRSHCAAIIGNKMICFGGWNSNGYLNSVDIYDFVTGAWTSAAGMLIPLSSHGAAVSSGKVYTWGGFNSSGVYNSMFVYDPSLEFDPQTDVSAWISINDGEDFQQFPNLDLFQRVNERYYLRGDISGISGKGAKQVRLKVQGNNQKDIKINAVSTGVKYQ